MSETVNYTSLMTDLQRYLERGFVTDPEVYAQLPRLIAQAQRSICAKFKIQGNINVVQTVMVPGKFAYAKPDRWRDTVSMLIGAPASSVAASVFPRSYEYIRTYAPDTAVRGKPKFYSDYDYFHWMIGPTPDLAYIWEISYYELPALISASNQTNWITEYAPGALLYRTLMEASIFLKNDERLAHFQPLYEEEVSNLDAQDIKKIVDRSTTRDEA